MSVNKIYFIKPVFYFCISLSSSASSSDSSYKSFSIMKFKTNIKISIIRTENIFLKKSSKLFFLFLESSSSNILKEKDYY